MNKRKTKILQTEKETYDGINRTINMQFRVTEEELGQIEKRREKLGICNRSAYLRKMALNGICINLNSKELSKASQLLWRTSNNMNQYAKKAATHPRGAVPSGKGSRERHSRPWRCQSRSTRSNANFFS